jgi:hypothetical protein
MWVVPNVIDVSKVLGLAMQGLQLGKGMIQAIVGAILDIVPPMIPPPVRAAARLKSLLDYIHARVLMV